MKRLFLCFSCALLAFSVTARGAQKPDLWVYEATNLSRDENITKLETLWRRAAAAGYTHVMLNDSRFQHLDALQDPKYIANLDKIKKLAAELKLDVVPETMAIGYSNDLLWNDPNLAEGLPVKDALFVVHDGKAELQADPPVNLGKPTSYDDTVKLQDGVATIGKHQNNARLIWQLPVSPYRCYHVSVMMKADRFSERPEIEALGGGMVLQYQYIEFKQTQDWTKAEVVFNSFNNKTVNVYMGVWGTATGTLQFKDWKIEEIGLTNVLRRPGTPCTVKADGNDKVYVEGTDYDAIKDPHLGNTPWNGEYVAYHPAPPITTKLPDGTRLRVSWYHPTIIYDGQVCACFEEPRTKEILAKTAELLQKDFGASGYMMAHDELRVLGWDESCLAVHQTAGKMLADNARYCTSLFPGSRVYAWSDMFDPYHNAVKDYFLVNGDLSGSWDGLDPSVIIMNWNFHKNLESMKFFADHGHKQIIAGYYDGDVNSITQWLANTKKVPGVVGVMYTTWGANYGDLEKYAELVKNYNYN